MAEECGVIRIGTKRTHNNTHIAGISGVTVAEGIGVVIDSNGHLGTVTPSVRYEAVNAMLLNEFLKEHKREEQQASIVELKSTVAQQQKGIDVLTAQLREEAAQIQKVKPSQVNKPAPQMVVNDQR